jgi:molecular chaperone GrpE
MTKETKDAKEEIQAKIDESKQKNEPRTKEQEAERARLKQEIQAKIDESRLKHQQEKLKSGNLPKTKEQELECAIQKQHEYLADMQRLQAEFDNFRKRIEKENANFREYAAAEFVKKILPVLDSFEMALKNNTDPEKFKKGVELIYAQLYSTLEEMGVKKIDCLNCKFDPYKHEVLMIDEKSGAEDEKIIEEFQKGYMFKSNVIRHSKVKIAKHNECCSDDCKKK